MGALSCHLLQVYYETRGEQPKVQKEDIPSAGPDSYKLCQLPVVVWTTVLGSLPSRDILTLSQTCNALCTTCSDYYRKKTVRLELNCSQRQATRRGDSSPTHPPGCLPLDQLEQLKAMGQWYGHVNIYTYCFAIQRSSYQALVQAFSRPSSALKSLSIDMPSDRALAIMTSPDVYNHSLTRLLRKLKVSKRNLDIFIDVKLLTSAATPLGTLLSLYDHSETAEIYRYVSSFDTSLCQQFPHDTEIYARKPHLTTTPTAKLVSKFPHVQTLYLHVYNLSDALLLQLSTARGEDQPQLKTLKIGYIVNCGTEDQPLPNLSSSAWQALVHSAKTLQVHFVVMHLSGVSLHSLLDVLKPEVPLLEMTLYSGDNACVRRIIAVCRIFSRTLRKVTINSVGIPKPLTTDTYDALWRLVRGSRYMRDIEPGSWSVKLY